MYLFVGWQNKETSDYNKGKTNAQQPECRKDETNAELLKRCRNKTNEEREEQAEAEAEREEQTEAEREEQAEAEAEREEQTEAEHEEAAKWVNIVGGPFSKDDNFCADLRRLQQRCGCSNTTCEDILTTFRKYLGIEGPKNWKSYDKKMREMAGAEMLRLNGCPKCRKHVYLPKSKATTCPYVQPNGAVCGAPRYDKKGDPKEVSFSF